MVCIKCGYSDPKEIERNGVKFCSVCGGFIPEKESDFNKYVLEKLDWKILDTFRKYNCSRGQKQKIGMINSAFSGKPMTRAPFGYSINDGKFIINEDATTVVKIFHTFLNENYSLNAISKQFGFSLNGIKKILQNRTYIGEVKFDGLLYKAKHKPIIDIDTFYAVELKLKKILKNKK